MYKTKISQRAYKYCRSSRRERGSSDPCYIYTKDSVISYYVKINFLNQNQKITHNQKYIYPLDVCSNEEPIFEAGTNPEEWTGFRVDRKTADSNEARRLLGMKLT